MNIRKKLAYIPMILVTLFTIVITVLVPSSLGLFQGSDGTPDAPGLTIDPISLIIGLAVGAAGVGIPVLIHSVSSKKHTKTGHVTLLKRTPDVEGAARESPPASGSPEVPEESVAGKHTKTGHVTLLKRTEDVQQGVRTSPPSTGSPQVPEGTEAGKHTKTGHVTLLK